MNIESQRCFTQSDLNKWIGKDEEGKTTADSKGSTNTQINNPHYRCRLTEDGVQVTEKASLSTKERFQARFGCGKASFTNVLWELTSQGKIVPQVKNEENSDTTTRNLNQTELKEIIAKITTFKVNHFFLGRSKKLNIVLEKLQNALDSTKKMDAKQQASQVTQEPNKQSSETIESTMTKNVSEVSNLQRGRESSNDKSTFIGKATSSETAFKQNLQELAMKDNDTILAAIQLMKQNKIGCGTTDYNGRSLAYQLITNCNNDSKEIQKRLPVIQALIKEMDEKELQQKTGLKEPHNILNLLLSKKNSNWILTQDKTILPQIIEKMPFDGLRGLTRQLTTLLSKETKNEALDEKVKILQAAIIKRQNALVLTENPKNLDMNNNEDLIKAFDCIESCRGEPQKKKEFENFLINAIKERDNLSDKQFVTEDGYIMHLAALSGSPRVLEAVLEKENLKKQIAYDGLVGRPLHTAIYSQVNANDKKLICEILIKASTPEQLSDKGDIATKTPLEAMQQEMKNEKQLIADLQKKLSTQAK